MTSRSSSTPSEGEIVESGSEKATTRSVNVRSTSVDRPSRKPTSVSRSPSPMQSPGYHRSRTHSRSPYREPRGAKRPHEDNDNQDRRRNDPRQFNIRYENRRFEDRRRGSSRYEDLDRSVKTAPNLRYDDRSAARGPRDKRRRTRSRSPKPFQPVADQTRHARVDKGARPGSRSWADRNGPEYSEGRGRPAQKQSVSDRGYSSVAAANVKHEAETQVTQDNGTADSVLERNGPSAEQDVVASEPQANEEAFKPVDEATMIEERRKRREAIKAKHRDQATPLLVHVLAHENATPSADVSQKVDTDQSHPLVSSMVSAPGTPKETLGSESPTAFVVANDAELANTEFVGDGAPRDDEPSAADYDPTMDMQEDKIRQDHHLQRDEVPSAAYDETIAPKQDVLLPNGGMKGSESPQRATKRTKDEFDMFADEDDMFAEAQPDPNIDVLKDSAIAVPIPQTQALDMGMLDDWDDPDGYYKVILGELLENRYHIQSNLGKGMFSGVVRATDQTTKRLVAIKIIRNNETMKRAGLKEIEILQKLSLADPEDKKHLIRLERFFEHKGHLCMVFENLSINLREVLKKFGRDVGINLKAVRAYAQQMFLGLSLLRKCNILHADLKPDNVLVNESRNVLKICDLGSASDASENEITQYLVSRFYRAPEIILGMPYDFGIDVWSIGCTLFELYTGKILFTGRSNNQMLRAIMECRGKFSHKFLRKAEFAGLHFDDLLNFRSVEKDRLTNKDVVRILNFTKPTRDLKTRLMANARGMSDTELKELSLFVDLLDRCLNLNPEKRCTPNQALKHPFITRMK